MKVRRGHAIHLPSQASFVDHLGEQHRYAHYSPVAFHVAQCCACAAMPLPDGVNVFHRGNEVFLSRGRREARLPRDPSQWFMTRDALEYLTANGAAVKQNPDAEKASK